MNDKSKRKYNIEIKPKINLKKKSLGIQSECSYCTKKEKKKISDSDICNLKGIHTQNNYLKTDNYFNLKNQFNKSSYNKLINIDNNQNIINSYIYNQNANNNNAKKNKKYIVNKNIIINIPEKLPKNLSNDNYFNNFSNKQIKTMTKGISIEKDKMKYLINIKKNEAKYIDIKNKNKILIHNKNCYFNRINNNLFENQRQKLSKTYEKINIEPNNTIINNIML